MNRPISQRSSRLTVHTIHSPSLHATGFLLKIPTSAEHARGQLYSSALLFNCQKPQTASEKFYSNRPARILGIMEYLLLSSRASFASRHGGAVNIIANDSASALFWTPHYYSSVQVGSSEIGLRLRDLLSHPLKATIL